MQQPLHRSAQRVTTDDDVSDFEGADSIHNRRRLRFLPIGQSLKQSLSISEDMILKLVKESLPFHSSQTRSE